MKRAFLISAIIHLIGLPLFIYCWVQPPAAPVAPPPLEVTLDKEELLKETASKVNAFVPQSLPAENRLFPAKANTEPAIFEMPTSKSNLTASKFAVATTAANSFPSSSEDSPMANHFATGTSTPAVTNVIGIATATASIKPPQIRHKVEPDYPVQARRNRLQGSVILEATILESGEIAQVTVGISSGSASLDQAAIEAVSQWSFRPAKDGASGLPIACVAKIPITFHIK